MAVAMLVAGFNAAHAQPWGFPDELEAFLAPADPVHLVAVNQLGMRKQGFIMDKSFSETVWNHPVYRYELKYFSVADRFPYVGISYDEARVPVTRRGLRDAYARYRSPRTRAILGVQIKLWFGVENRHPNHAETDDESMDKIDTLTLRYDLELTDSDEIVGGEWREYENPFKPRIDETRGYTHPSILWLVPQGARAWSVADAKALSTPWDGQGPAPESWRKAAQVASLNNELETIQGVAVQIPTPQPLAPVVDLLVGLSRR